MPVLTAQVAVRRPDPKPAAPLAANPDAFERRGAGRARNVVRPAFADKKAAAFAPAPSPVQARAATGTHDEADWEQF